MNEEIFATSLPLTYEDMFIGMDVICVFACEWQSMVGKIHSIASDHDGYTVKDSNGNWIGSERGWANAESFRRVKFGPINAGTPPKVEKTPQVIAVAPVEAKPCTSYYYGPSHCTCGKCNKKKKW